MADGSLIFDTKVDSSGLKNGITKLSKVATKAIGLMSASVGVFGAYATKSGADFQEAMSEVKAISGATAKDIEKLADKAKEMGSKTKFSAKESAEALKYMSMAGWDTEKMLSGLPGIMNLASASGEELAIVADIVTDSMTAFGLSADKAIHFSNVLAQASNKSNTNVAMLGESFKYVAPVAGSLGYTIEDISLALGLMANSGVKASIAGTALRTALTRLVKPKRETLKGFEKLGLAMENLEGLSLREILYKLRTEFKHLSESQKAQASAMIFGQEAMSGMLAIINSSEEDFENLAKSIDNATGSAEKMSNIMIDNLKGDITIAKSALEGLAIAFYEGIDNPLREVVKNTTGYLNELSYAFKSTEDLKKELISKGFSSEQADLQINEAGMSNAVGGFSGFFGKIGTVLSKLVGDIASYTPRFIQSGIDLFNSLLQGFTQNKDIIMKGAFDSIITLLTGINEVLPDFFVFGVDLLVSFLNGISNNSGEIVSKGIDIVIRLADAIIKSIPKLGKATFDCVVALARGIAKNLPRLVQEVPRIINEFASALYSLLPNLIVAGFKLLVEIGKGIISAIPIVIKNIPQIITAIINIFTMFNWFSIGKSILNGIGIGIVKGKNILFSMLKNISNNIIEIFRYLLSGGGVQLIGKNIIQGILSGISTMKNIAMNMITNLCSKMLTTFKMTANINTLLNLGKDVVNGIIKGISSMAGILVNTLKNVASSALNGVKKFLGIKSPSRKAKDELGKPISQGIAIGILSERNRLNEALINISDEAFENAKKNANSYEEIGKIYIAKLGTGIDKASKNSIDSVNKLVDSTIDTLNTKNKKAILKYKRAGEEVSKAYAISIKDGISKIKEDIGNEINRIAQEAQKQYDDITSMQNNMVDKLSGFGDLFTIDSETNEMNIKSISEQINAIKEYDNVLSNLKSKGSTDEFMSEITKMSVDDAIKFGKELLKMSDNQFKTYQNNWSEKQKLAKSVASKFYKEQLDTLQYDFVNRLDNTLKSVPNIVKNIGINTIQGMIDGMDNRKQGAINKAREIADAIAMEMKKSLDIHSPSRLMRDLIGKNIVRGVEVGIDEEKLNLFNKLKSLVDSAKNEMGTMVKSRNSENMKSTHIVNNNDKGVNQTLNIYTPVKSSIELMREAKRSAKELAYG